MEERGFMPCSKEELEELEKKPLSEDKLEKLDSVLSQLYLSVRTVRRMQADIEKSQLIVPAFSGRLSRMKWLLDGEIRTVSDYIAKGVGSSPSLICDVALQLLNQLNPVLLTMASDWHKVDSDGAVISDLAIAKMKSNKFET